MGERASPTLALAAVAHADPYQAVGGGNHNERGNTQCNSYHRCCRYKRDEVVLAFSSCITESNKKLERFKHRDSLQSSETHYIVRFNI